MKLPLNRFPLYEPPTLGEMFYVVSERGREYAQKHVPYTYGGNRPLVEGYLGSFNNVSQTALGAYLVTEISGPTITLRKLNVT